MQRKGNDVSVKGGYKLGIYRSGDREDIITTSPKQHNPLGVLATQNLTRGEDELKNTNKREINLNQN